MPWFSSQNFSFKTHNETWINLGMYWLMNLLKYEKINVCMYAWMNVDMNICKNKCMYDECNINNCLFLHNFKCFFQSCAYFSIPLCQILYWIYIELLAWFIIVILFILKKNVTSSILFINIYKRIINTFVLFLVINQYIN